MPQLFLDGDWVPCLRSTWEARLSKRTSAGGGEGGGKPPTSFSALGAGGKSGALVGSWGKGYWK